MSTETADSNDLVDDQADVEDVEEVESPEDETEDNSDDGDFDRDRVLSKLKKLNSENRNLRKAKKEAEEKAGQAGADSERVQALEAVKARYETLADNELPLKLAKWIDATDPDQILEEAEELLSLGGGGRQAPPTESPKEKLGRVRDKSALGDEIGDLDDFASTVYKN